MPAMPAKSPHTIMHDEIDVPDGMVQAVCDGFGSHSDTHVLLRARLAVALAWLANNPIQPTVPQQQQLSIGVYQASVIVRWQRIAFLKPPPEFPEVILAALATLDEDKSSNVAALMFGIYEAGRRDAANEAD